VLSGGSAGELTGGAGSYYWHGAPRDGGVEPDGDDLA
jgi:hypothetical protein